MKTNPIPGPQLHKKTSEQLRKLAEKNKQTKVRKAANK